MLAVEQEDYEVAKRLKHLIDIENKNIEQSYGIDLQKGIKYEQTNAFKQIDKEKLNINYNSNSLIKLEESVNQLKESVDR